jgi:hypothetical protein
MDMGEDEEFEEFDDEEAIRQFVTVQEVVNLLQYNESHQRAINRNQAELQDWFKSCARAE